MDPRKLFIIARMLLRAPCVPDHQASKGSIAVVAAPTIAHRIVRTPRFRAFATSSVVESCVSMGWGTLSGCSSSSVAIVPYPLPFWTVLSRKTRLISHYA